MIPENENHARADSDTAWKEILRLHLKDFVEFFWMEAYVDIDWERPYEVLEQELIALGVKNEIGKKYADKLFKVYLKNGKEQWILLHIEVQNNFDEDFSKRMFTYFYRIYDRYNQNVASMAVLADKNKNWYPKHFHQKIWNSSVTRTYELVKLLDYKAKELQLLQSANPFALVVLLQLAAMETRSNDKQRLMTKLEYFRYLHKHGWEIEKSMNLYRFMDTILNLKPDFELQYHQQAKQIDQEYGMRYMANIERTAYQEGAVQGYQQGEANILINQLKIKFKEIPEEYIHKIKNADINSIDKWGVNFVFANSLDEVFNNQAVVTASNTQEAVV